MPSVPRRHERVPRSRRISSRGCRDAARRPLPTLAPAPVLRGDETAISRRRRPRLPFASEAVPRVLHVHPGRSATLSGVTLRGGYVSGSNASGGALLNEG